MKQNAKFDYYYGMQADTYSFYRIPKVLFTDPFFKGLSCEAKVLYGLMLDRMSLSIRNKWLDEQGRVYIIFKVEDIKKHLACCRQTAINLLAELDTDKGIGLIEKKRLGFGKANIIYVKNFVLREEPDGEDPPDKDEDPDSEEVMPGQPPESINHTSRSPENRLQEVQKVDFCEKTQKTGECLENSALEDPEAGCKKSKKQTSRSLENRLQEVQKIDFSKSTEQTSRSPESRLQEVRKIDFSKSTEQTLRSPESRLQEVYETDPNYNEYNNTEKNNNDSYLSINDARLPACAPPHCDRQEIDTDEKEVRQAYIDIISENIAYEALCSMYQKEQIDELLTLMVDTVCTTRSKVTVGGENVSAENVKSRLLKLDFFHMQYVINCLHDNTTKVRNIRQYVLAALYNAPTTMHHYYAADVNHGMYG